MPSSQPEEHRRHLYALDPRVEREGGGGMGRRTKEKGSNGIKGCMSGVLQLLDFRQEAIDPPHLSEANTVTSAAHLLPPREDASRTGTKAPRSSPEWLEATSKDCLQENRQSRWIYEQDAGIPMDFERSEEVPKDSVRSGMKSKSTNVVARLMGVDIFPDETEDGRRKEAIAMDSSMNISANHTNRHRNSSNHKHREKNLKEPNNALRILEKRCENLITSEPCSLPSTPRISSSRRSDVHPRLSLQIPKENTLLYINNRVHPRGLSDASPPSSSSSFSSRNLDTTRRSCNFSSNTENIKPTSPRFVVSSVSPRYPKPLIRDLTNSTPEFSPRITTKCKPSIETEKGNSSSQRNLTKNRVCSQPFLQESKKSTTKESTSKSENIRAGCNKPKFDYQLEFVRKINDGVEERRSRKVIRGGKRIKEKYVRVVKVNVEEKKKKKRQTPISDSFVRMRKEAIASFVPKRQECAQRAHHTEPSKKANNPSAFVAAATHHGAHITLDDDNVSHHAHTSQENSPSSSMPKERENGPIIMYASIKTILELMGIRNNTNVFLVHWYSPSHPLDPAIFNKMEEHHQHDQHGHHPRHHHGIMVNTSSNRKLVFELVDELLRERLRSCIMVHVRPWMLMMMMMEGPRCTLEPLTGKELLHDVWMDVRGIPSKDCKIVEDIDGLIANDVGTGHRSSPINEHEGDSVAEAILFGIVQEIAESLVTEAVRDFLSLE